MLFYKFTNSDEYPAKETTDNYMHIVSSEVKNLKYSKENIVDVPFYLDENYITNEYYKNNNQNKNKEDYDLVEKNIQEYINVDDFGSRPYHPSIKHLRSPEDIENLNDLKQSLYSQSKKGHPDPKDIPDPSHFYNKFNKAHALEDEDIRIEFFIPYNNADYSYHIKNHSNNRFNIYSNELNSVFHTQVNVDSPGSNFNIGNEFSLLNDISAESSNYDEIQVRAKDKLNKKPLSEALTNTTAESDEELLSDLRDDGYHYNKPSINFFY